MTCQCEYGGPCSKVSTCRMDSEVADVTEQLDRAVVALRDLLDFAKHGDTSGRGRSIYQVKQDARAFLNDIDGIQAVECDNCNGTGQVYASQAGEDPDLHSCPDCNRARAYRVIADRRPDWIAPTGRHMLPCGCLYDGGRQQFICYAHDNLEASIRFNELVAKGNNNR